VMKLLGARGVSAVMGIVVLAMGSSEASAQSTALNVPAAVRALDANPSAQPLGTTRMVTTQTSTSKITALLTTPNSVTLSNGAVVPAQPAQSVTVQLPPSIDREAAWLYKNGWPLYALVAKYSTGAPLNDEATCIATAVYFEARGESLEGQMAVADVIMNRASSGRYPSSWCAVVKQPAQFSFVQHGQFPAVDTASTAWARAQGVTRLALANVVPSLTTDVLWYHADYVAPSWGHRLSFAQKIGQHIFYRS